MGGMGASGPYPGESIEMARSELGVKWSYTSKEISTYSITAPAERGNQLFHVPDKLIPRGKPQSGLTAARPESFGMALHRGKAILCEVRQAASPRQVLAPRV